MLTKLKMHANEEVTVAIGGLSNQIRNEKWSQGREQYSSQLFQQLSTKGWATVWWQIRDEVEIPVGEHLREEVYLDAY